MKREREERERLESVRREKFVSSLLRGKAGPAHRMGIDTSAGP